MGNNNGQPPVTGQTVKELEQVARTRPIAEITITLSGTGVNVRGANDPILACGLIEVAKSIILGRLRQTSTMVEGQRSSGLIAP